MAVTKPIPPEAAHIPPETLNSALIAIGRLLERAPDARSTKRGGPLTVAKVRAESGVENGAAGLALKLWRAGKLDVEDRFGGETRPVRAASEDQDADPAAELAERVRGATTDGDREQILHELSALVLEGALDAKAASVVKACFDEARKAGETKRAVEPPPEDPTRFLLASAEAMEAARALDWMVDDDRRTRVLSLIARELEADRLEHPNTDEGGA